MNILDFEDSTADFTDPGNEAGKEACGGRDFVLLDADNGDAVISGHAWIALALENASTGNWRMTFTPRGNKGAVNLKVRITS